MCAKYIFALKRATFRFDDERCPDDPKLEEPCHTVMARWHPSRAAKLAWRSLIQTWAVGIDLLSGILAPRQVINGLPGLGRSSNLVSSGRAYLGAAVVWRHAVFTAGVDFHPG